MYIYLYFNQMGFATPDYCLQLLEDVIWNICRFWFLCGIVFGFCFILSGISKSKVTNVKIPGFFFKKVCPQPVSPIKVSHIQH